MEIIVYHSDQLLRFSLQSFVGPLTWLSERVAVDERIPRVSLEAAASRCVVDDVTLSVLATGPRAGVPALGPDAG